MASPIMRAPGNYGIKIIERCATYTHRIRQKTILGVYLRVCIVNRLIVLSGFSGV